MKTHANLDRYSRYRKAQKIDQLMAMYFPISGGKFLEVGTGSGFIAEYFSEHWFGENNTFAVDVVDERQTKSGFQFSVVSGVDLPFNSEYFDFVVTNHVIEHVGDYDNQVKHIYEISRVLKPGGVIYFAVPNQWSLIEPHYNLPLLSWLPPTLASIYVKLLRRGSYYDCKPLSHYNALNLLNLNHLDCKDVTLDAIQIYCSIERGVFARIIAKIPKVFFRFFAMFMPTLIFVCRKPKD